MRSLLPLFLMPLSLKQLTRSDAAAVISFPLFFSYGSINGGSGHCSPFFQFLRLLSHDACYCSCQDVSPSRKQEQTKYHAFKNQAWLPHILIVSPSSVPVLHCPTPNCFQSPVQPCLSFRCKTIPICPFASDSHSRINHDVGTSSIYP